MAPLYYELPQQIVSLLNTIGPIYKEMAKKRHYSVDIIVRPDNNFVGFLITTKSLAEEPQLPRPYEDGMLVPVEPRFVGDSSYIFTHTLKDCLDYIKGDGEKTP